MTSTNATTSSPRDLLAHLSLNPDNSKTIVFIHGAFGSSKDWDIVAPYLPTYHLLVPDLPGHGSSRSFRPFSKARSADLLAHLIKIKAKNGIAHVVGLSLGASVGLELACTHPDVVDSLLISGYGRLPKSKLTPYLPYAIWTSNLVENMIPRPAVRWLMDGADLPRQNASAFDVELIGQCFGDGMTTDEWPEPWPARTLIIAATKRGVIPSDDRADYAKKLGEIGRRGNAESKAVEHKMMRHPWSRQDPELFARTVRAWIEGGELPEGLEGL